MLDLWLESAASKTKIAEQNERYMRALEQLPVDELLAMTRGESPLNKLAYSDGSTGDACWLDQFQGSALYSKALALEKQGLELDMNETADRLQREQGSDQVRNQRDVLRVQRRMLELELAQSRHQGAGGEVQVEAPAGAPVSVSQDGTQGAGPETQNPTQASAVKSAAELTEASRDKIAPKNFALSSKQSDTGKPAYPIEDKRHAANALSRVGQNGSASEKAEVYKDVARKYPELARHSDVPAVKAKVASEKCGYCGKQDGSCTCSSKVAAMRFQLGMQKIGFPIPAAGNLLQAAKNVGQLGLHMAKANPALAGAALGAGAGAIAGGPGNRLGGALGGAALGGAGGFAAPRMMQGMKNGLSLGEAAKATGQAGLNQLGSMVGNALPGRQAPAPRPLTGTPTVVA